MVEYCFRPSESVEAKLRPLVASVAGELIDRLGGILIFARTALSIFL